MEERMRIETENITLVNFSPKNFFEAFLRIKNEGRGDYKVEKVEKMEKMENVKGSKEPA